MYGAGQGLNEGVKTAASFILPAMQMKQQQKQFDAGLAQREKQLQQQNRQYYDRMTLSRGWDDGYYGGPSPWDEQSPVGAPPSGSQVPMAPTSGESLAQVGRLAVPSFQRTQPAASPGAVRMDDAGNTIRMGVKPPIATNAPSYSMPGMRPNEVPAQNTGIRSIRPNTPMPSVGMMRSGGFRRGY